MICPIDRPETAPQCQLKSKERSLSMRIRGSHVIAGTVDRKTLCRGQPWARKHKPIPVS